MGEYYIGYTPKTRQKFYFDSENYNVVKNHKWIMNSKNSPFTKINKHDIPMVKLLYGNNIYTYINGMYNDLRNENVKRLRGFKNNGKVFLKGYISIYMPEHKRAFENGCVYEHIIIAEKKLGRELKPEECVHHIDFDRTNNNEENLMVFKTNEDHIAFHGGGTPVLQDDGTYITKSKYEHVFTYINRTKKDIENKVVDIGGIYVYGKDLCPICKKNIKVKNAKMCHECWSNEIAKNIPSKEELEPLIYKESFREVARMYNVTDNAVRRWCKKYELPFRKKDIK